jgi:hypothetical protein
MSKHGFNCHATKLFIHKILVVMALDTPVTYHVAFLNSRAAAYMTPPKVRAGGSQLSCRSGALLHDISVSFETRLQTLPSLREIEHNIAPLHIFT